MSNDAGVDWAAEEHDVLVQNEAGEELVQGSFPHDEQGLRSLCRALQRLDGGAGGDRAAGRALIV